MQHLFVPLNVFLLSVCLLVCTAAAGMSGFAIALTCGAALGFAVASSVYALAPPPPRRAVGAARASPPLRAGALPLSHAANTRAPPTRVPQPPLIAAAAAAADVKGTLAEKVAIAPPRLTFDAAVAYIRDCTALSNSQRLEAYALFKQAKDGDAPRSSPFRPVAAAKWRAWATKRGLPTVDAQAAYAALAVSAGAPLPLVPPLPVAVASAPAESAAPAAAAATAATISPASPPAASTLVVATPRRTLSELSLGATPTMAQMLPPLPRSLFAGLNAQQCAALRHANASLPRSLRYALDPVGTGWTYFKTAEDVAMYTQSFNERGHMYEGCLGVGVINAPMTDVLRAIYTLPRKNEYDAHWDGERDVERMQLGSPSWEEELASAVNARDPEEAGSGSGSGSGTRSSTTRSSLSSFSLSSGAVAAPTAPRERDGYSLISWVNTEGSAVATLFGGYENGSRRDDVFEMELNSSEGGGAWTRKLLTSGTPPTARSGHSAVTWRKRGGLGVEETQPIMTVFGGWDQAFCADVHELDLTARAHGSAATSDSASSSLTNQWHRVRGAKGGCSVVHNIVLFMFYFLFTN